LFTELHIRARVHCPAAPADGCPEINLVLKSFTAALDDAKFLLAQCVFSLAPLETSTSNGKSRPMLKSKRTLRKVGLLSIVCGYRWTFLRKVHLKPHTTIGLLSSDYNTVVVS